MGQSVFVLLEGMRRFALTDVLEPRQRIWLSQFCEMCVAPDSSLASVQELVTAVKPNSFWHAPGAWQSIAWGDLNICDRFFVIHGHFTPAMVSLFTPLQAR